ncbi:sensor histidine kinase [Flaviaesturariibacter terrae]
MNEVVDFFRKLFDTSDWPPRWHCGNWTEFHGWLYIISDLLIWSAYFAIPLAILRYASRRAHARFMRIYFLFAAFILACGSTHLLDALVFWFPAYRLSALVRLITGIISWITVFYLVRYMPLALSLRSAEELEREVQEREKAEEQLRVAVSQLTVAQEIARLGHWQWDVRSNIVSWSPGMYRVFGIGPSEPVGHYEEFLARLHPEDRSFVDATIREAMAKKRFESFTYRTITPSGALRIVQSRGEVLVDAAGTVTGMIGTSQDITEQSEVQRALLENAAQLEASNAELRKFAYLASHDLQEPLRKIRTFISLLEQQPGVVGSAGGSYFEKISSSAERMQVLIDDILRFSRLQNNDAAFVDTDLDRLLQQELKELAISIRESGARIEADPLPVIRAVPAQMGQLLQNLLRNALRFQRPGVPPLIEVRCRRLAEAELPEAVRATVSRDHARFGGRLPQQWVELCVRDNGIGFDPAYSEKIFEIFQRLHPNHSYQGTGIGLAIVKKVVDQHRGVVRAEGRPGEGAAFFVWLPA